MDEVLGERVDLTEPKMAQRDVIGRAYSRAAHVRARRDMMQRWADYLDKLKCSAA